MRRDNASVSPDTSPPQVPSGQRVASEEPETRRRRLLEKVRMTAADGRQSQNWRRNDTADNAPLPSRT